MQQRAATTALWLTIGLAALAGCTTLAQGPGVPGASPGAMPSPVTSASPTAYPSATAASGPAVLKGIYSSVSTFAGTGTPGSNDGAASSATFNSPHGIAIDESGNLYVADTGNNRLRRISNGTVTTLASTGAWATNPASPAQFQAPRGVAVDSTGNVYVAESSQIRVLTPQGLAVFAGTTTPGHTDGATSSAQFNLPAGLAFDASGSLLIADSNAQDGYNNPGYIRKITGGTVTTLTTLGKWDTNPSSPQTYMAPTGVAVDPSQNLFIVGYSEDNTIHELPVGSASITFAGSLTGGFQNGGLTSARFNWPFGITADTQGNLVVADSWNNSVRAVRGSTVTTIAGFGDLTGALTDGATTSANFHYPTSVAIDGAGTLYVADMRNHAVRIIR